MYRENIDKLYNFLKIMWFMVQTDYLKLMFHNREALINKYQIKFAEGYKGPRFINELMSFAP